MGVCNCSMFCCTLLYVHSSIAIILMGKRELVALLNLSSWCLVMVERLFLAVPRGCLRFVIVVFPDHTHFLFLVVECLTRDQGVASSSLEPHWRHCIVSLSKTLHRLLSSSSTQLWSWQMTFLLFWTGKRLIWDKATMLITVYVQWRNWWQGR